MSSVKKVFLSYAPEDEPLRTELEKHLSPLERSGKAIIWHSGKVLPGDEGAHAIDKQLSTADLILLLVTPSFLASDPLHDEQLQPALVRRETAGARVVPILAKPCAWRTSALGTLEPLPRNRMPITLWPHPDQAWLEVVDALADVLVQSPNQLQLSALPTFQAPPARIDGVWIDVETSSTFCMRIIDEHIRGCYCYVGQDCLVGELHHCSFVSGAMFARFRWMDGRVHGYTHMRLQSANEAIGGWWFEHDVPDRIKSDLSRLTESLPGMVPSRWIRRKFTAMPHWAETYFAERQWTA